ncbi:hypothetical protein [Spongiactinospora sp. TRM90649]|uniref:hypothetical protein n=1 Tax=Spongiactinospora sp. TRM90649 TaxID=3031114 RepID=UPI0023F9D85E|nr:hypothetical protein [Spongiactinospora sp. TRM90649]MDF5759072.1 hypothetical protein [Spongiactinospora sp. TRM90649]
MTTNTPVRVLARALCLMGALTSVAGCGAAPYGPVTGKRVEPRILTEEWDCDGEAVAAPIGVPGPDGCVRATRYVPERYRLTIGRAEKVEVERWQYRRCEIGERYPDCARD